MADGTRLRVMILTLSFGSGHVRAARAVGEAVALEDVHADVRCLDALERSRWFFRALYVWPYWVMIRHARWLWARMFSARLARVQRHTAPGWFFRAGCPHVFAEIRQFRPDVIVAVEVAACEMALLAKRHGMTRAVVVDVITDFHAEPGWVAPEVDRYAVADERVAPQLTAWGAPPDRIVACGIPIPKAFRDAGDPDRGQTGVRPGSDQGQTGVRPGSDPHPPRPPGSTPAPVDDRPLVLLMCGGMGPTRIDRVAAGLCSGEVPMRVIAIAGHDRAAYRRLSRIHGTTRVSLEVRAWTDDVAGLMRNASVLVTKPGGVTLAEAFASGVPLVVVDPIPGPEESNVALAKEAGAAILATAATAADSVKHLLRNADQLRAMGAAASMQARPNAARAVWRIAADACQHRSDGAPALILTIRNGAGHTSVASAIAHALTDEGGPSALVVDVADYMTPFTRFTHVVAYLWLVKYAPWLWAHIDRYQKRQPHTSPEWYYRRGCQRLWNLVEQIRPRALVATEVGCCEIAALVKRDLGLRVPLVAVNGEYDVDRAWVQPEVDLYTVPTAAERSALVRLGAPDERVRAWGVPIAPTFHVFDDRGSLRAHVCASLNLRADAPLVIVAGGSEGLGVVEAAAARLLQIDQLEVQLIVLAGRSERLKRRVMRLSLRYPDTLRVIGWTARMPQLLRAADLLVSKLGHTFDEAVASCLPIVALPPPPGAELIQYRLLEQWSVGRAVRDLDEMAAVVGALLTDRSQLAALRAATVAHSQPLAARRIAEWMRSAINAAPTTDPVRRPNHVGAPVS